MLRRLEWDCNQAVGVVRTGPRLIPAFLDQLGANRSCQEANPPGRTGNRTISNLRLAGLRGIFIPLSDASGAEAESGSSGKGGPCAKSAGSPSRNSTHSPDPSCSTCSIIHRATREVGRSES
jgi:hypothetical protein